MPANATRRGFLQQSAGVALGAAGLYELVDILAGSPARAAATVGAARRPSSTCCVTSGCSPTTASRSSPRRCTTSSSRRGCESHGRKRHCARRQRELEQVLREVDSRFPATPAGLGLTVAWGLPYFRRFVPGPWRRYAPRDLRAKQACAPRRDPLPERLPVGDPRAQRPRGAAPERPSRPRRDRREADLRTTRASCSKSRASARASSAAATTAVAACRSRWP